MRLTTFTAAATLFFICQKLIFEQKPGKKGARALPKEGVPGNTCLVKVQTENRAIIQITSRLEVPCIGS